jgi:hypothetical protein
MKSFLLSSLIANTLLLSECKILVKTYLSERAQAGISKFLGEISLRLRSRLPKFCTLVVSIIVVVVLDGDEDGSEDENSGTSGS